MNNYAMKIMIFAIAMVIGFTSEAKILFNQKYVTVGVLSNDSLPQLSNNQNIRFMGVVDKDSLLTDGGQIMLDKLFNLNHPSIEDLYRKGLSESTTEEYEIAVKDISADPTIILKSEGAMQLLKNNYIVIFEKEFKNKEEKDEEIKKIKWFVYHVEIDDEVINQVFFNWKYPKSLREISVPLELVASGKINKNKISNIIFNISKKVGAFAIRGPILSDKPCISAITSIQGVKKGDKVKVYQTFENEPGKLFSKKVADTRVLYSDGSGSRLKTISGKYPSRKNGEIACLMGRGDWSIGFEGEYSLGSDWRAGAKLWLDRRFYYMSNGVSWHIIIGGEINQYNKDPLNIWFKKESFASRSVQPSLRSYGGFIGFAMGYSFLTKFEILPFATVGASFSSMTKNAYIWNAEEQKFNMSGGYFSIPVCVGVKLAVNICYPLQLLIGLNYNYSISTPNVLTELHDINRLSISAGLRYQF